MRIDEAIDASIVGLQEVSIKIKDQVAGVSVRC